MLVLVGCGAMAEDAIVEAPEPETVPVQKARARVVDERDAARLNAKVPLLCDMLTHEERVALADAGTH